MKKFPYMLNTKYKILNTLFFWKSLSPRRKLYFEVILGSLLIVLIPLALSSLQKPTPAKAAWLDDRWAYREAISITNGSGSALTDYQIFFSLDTATLITNGKVKSDCSDLRVYDLNGKLLPHWIETGTNACNTATTAIWTKVTSIPASGATIYVYYGNPTASNVASGSKVFDFFDDFGDGTISSSWTQHAGNGTITETGGILRLNCAAGVSCDWWGGGTESGTYVSTPRPSSGNYTFEARISAFDNPDYTQAGLMEVTDDNNGSFWGPYDNGSVDQISLEGVNADSGVSYGTTGVNIANSANTGKLTARVTRDSSTTYLLNDTSAGSYATWSNESKIGMVLKDWNSGASSTVDFDYFYTRKYASTEPTQALGSEEQSTAPIAYWKFDDGQGSTAQDSTSNNLDGVISGPTWVTEDQCISGKCLNFTLDANPVTITNGYSKTISGQAAFAIEMWLKIPGTLPAEIDLFGSANTNMNGYTDSTGILYFQTNVSNQVITGAEITTNKWYHLAFVKTGASSGKIYINGVEKATGTLDTTPTVAGENLTIGDSGGGMGAPANGYIDEVKIYNQSRTAAQIKQDYASGLANAGTKQGTSAVLGSSPEKWLSDGLVGFWKQDEATWSGTASEVVDSSGNANHGTAQGATNAKAYPTTGKFGNGGYFDGVDDYVSFTNSSSITGISSSGTISLWVKLTALPSGSNMATLIDVDGTGCSARGLDFYLTSTSFALQYGIGSCININSTTTPTTGTWYHLVTTWDRASGAKMYVNAVLEDTDTSLPTFNIAQATSYIGAQTGTLRFLNGTIDELRMYNRALTSREVSDLYNWAPGPVGYWNFEEKTGTTAYDTSGNGNNTNSWSGTPKWAQGKYGSGLSFDGSSNLQVDANANFNVRALTIEGWIKTPSTMGGTVYKALFSKQGADRDYNFYTYSSDGTKVTSLHFSSARWTTGNPLQSLPTAFEPNTWHHVAVTVDSSNLKFYADGVNFYTTSSTDAYANNSYNVWIARADNYWNGRMDDVKIYNYARTQKQIVSDMNGGHPAVGSPVGSALGYWKFDEGYGTTANSSGSSATNDSITGGTWTNSGRFGRALIFDGNDFVQTTYTFPTTNFSYSFWARSSSSGIDNRPFGAADGSAGLNGTSIIWGYPTSSQMLVIFRQGANEGTWDITATPPNMATDWHQVVVTLDSTNGASLYWDGSLLTSKAATKLITTGSLQLRIGREANSNSYFNGTIDEVKVYNYVLTSDEVKNEYNRGSSLVLGAMSDTSGLTGGSSASNSAAAEFCVSGDTSTCTAPILLWKLEEPSGNVNDTSGNANTGTATGTSVISGKIGKARSFNGSTSDYISSPSITASSFTLEYWLYNKGVAADYNRITSNGTDQFETGLLTNDTLQYYDGTWSSAGFTITRNTWTHVAFTYNGSTLYTYKNGVQVGSDGTSRGLSGVLRLGCRYNGLSECANVNLDEVRVFNYARSAAQIAWDYNRGAPVGHWKFDECQGTTLNDSSGNSYSGTLTIGASGEDTVGTCTISSTAWGSGVTGKRNYSISFDGTDDYADLGSTTLLDTSKPFTISAWAYLNDFSPNTYPHLLLFKATGSTTPFEIAFSNQASYLGVLIGSESTWAKLKSDTAAANLTGAWKHVVVTYNGSGAGTAGNFQIYLNGNLLTLTAASTFSALTSVNSAGGPQGGGSSNFWDGQIDDIKVYNYALTAAQVRNLANEGTVRFGPATGAP